jgi:signal transduction histidine kinase
MLDPSDAYKPETQSDRDFDFSSLLSNPNNGVWELIFDSLPYMVALIDLDNIIVKANKVMRDKLKVGDQGIVGHTCFNMMHENGCAKENCPHLSMIIDRKSHSIELYEPRFDSYLNISTTPIFDIDNNLLGSLHIARDISIQKSSEAKLRKYNNELKELNQSKDKFFSILAHDLRSPFQGMLGFTDFILDELDTLSKADIKEYLQKVRDSSYSAFSLLENLLNWSRLQTGKLQYKPSVFNIKEDVASITSLLEANAVNKNISLINNISDDFTVFADQQMVHSILLNLTANAIKFTHPGGKVSIDVQIKPMCDENVESGKICRHKCLEISISDTGIGIPADALERLFKMDGQFTQVGTAKEQGAGLGLLLAKEMTERHGGSLTVQSEELKGSVFSFTLPLEI